MKLKSVRLNNFRRFTDLTIQNLPESARLVVLAGPNGVGKSSFFDGLLTWYRFRAWSSAHGSAEYNSKIGTNNPQQYYERVLVDLHGPTLQGAELQSAGIYFRTAYRHEVDFQVQQIGQQPSPTANGGPARRAVDADQAVSENYQRLLWQTFSAVFDEETSESATKTEIRERLTGRLREALLAVFPDLTLTRVGGIDRGHSFEFTKGSSTGFPYVNLSAGEKAVFDLLLDAVVKADFYKNAIWCIDEPEVHVGTKAQGLLLRQLLALVPDGSQLFLASHSIGLMSEAVKLAHEDKGSVAFLDFGGHNFDQPVSLEPVEPSRSFWKGVLRVALEDIAALVAPSVLVLCEGSSDGFDAKCYRTIFATEFPDIDFVSVGNSHDTQTDKLGLTSAMQTVADGTTVVRLRDRDLASDTEVEEWRSKGVRVLSRRHIEAYLYDPQVLASLCIALGKPDMQEAVEAARSDRIAELPGRGKDDDDLKAASGLISTDVRRLLGIKGAGTTARAFAEHHLAPLIKPGTAAYDDLKACVFG